MGGGSPEGRSLAWLGVLFGAVGAITGIIGTVYGVRGHRLAAGVTELDRRLQAQELLDSAFDTLGGDAGSLTSHRPVSDPVTLELVERKIGRAEALTPDDPKIFLCRGAYYEARGDLDAALESYEQAQELAGGSYAPAQANMGIVLANQGKLEAAGHLLNEAAREHQDSPSVHTNLCFVLFMQQRLEDAGKACTKALELDDRYLPAHQSLGVVLLAQGNFVGAARRLELARAINPHNPAILANLGLAYRYNGEMEKALRTLKDALAADPSSGLVRRELGALYRMQGETLRAEVVEVSAEPLIEVH